MSNQRGTDLPEFINDLDGGVFAEKVKGAEAAKDIADTLSKSRNVTYLPSGGQNMLLNLGAGGQGA